MIDKFINESLSGLMNDNLLNYNMTSSRVVVLLVIYGWWVQRFQKWIFGWVICGVRSSFVVGGMGAFMMVYNVVNLLHNLHQKMVLSRR